MTLQDCVAFDQAQIERAFQHVAAAVHDHRAPTAALAVANHERIIRCDAFASTNDMSVRTDSIFPLASISKPIMAIAMMQLVEDGLLLLDQPIADYLPAFGAPGKAAVTPWHILTHTSGIPEIDWFTALGQRPQRAVSFEVACHQHVLFEPGARFQYSTLSFYVLAELVQLLSGLPYHQFVQQRIFAPLGMPDTSFDPRASQDRMVPIIGISGSETISAEQATDFFISLTMPGAGLWSTIVDLTTLGQALLRAYHGTDELLAPATMELMTREHTQGLVKQESGRSIPVHYSLGWRKGRMNGQSALPGSPDVFEHDGAAGGELWIDPQWNVVFVYLTNEFGTDNTVWRTTLPMVYKALRQC